MTIGLAPLGGWIAVTGKFTLASIIFYVAVAFWIGGFDIIYATQDEEHDRNEGLYSIPSRFGIGTALFLARGFHFVTAAGLISLFFFLTGLSWWYLAGVVISYGILMYEHSIVSPQNMSKLQTAFFFTMNGVLSIVMFVFFTFIDLVIRYA